MHIGTKVIFKVSHYLFRRRELPIFGTSSWTLALFIALGTVSFVSCTWLVTEESTNKSAEVEGSPQHQLRNYLKTLSCHCRRYQIRAQASWIRPM